MGDDNNDFTFSVNQNLIVTDDVPDIGAVTLEDDLASSSTNTDASSSSKIDKEVGSLSFTFAGMSSVKPKNEVLKEPIKEEEEEVFTTRKPIVRSKVPFEKGYSQMDWLKLTRTHPDLAGLKGVSNKRLISMDEVKQHRTKGSIWTVLKGRVYNITPYMNFHPGGVDMLMKGAGKDCTSLFSILELLLFLYRFFRYDLSHQIRESYHEFALLTEIHKFALTEIREFALLTEIRDGSALLAREKYAPNLAGTLELIPTQFPSLNYNFQVLFLS